MILNFELATPKNYKRSSTKENRQIACISSWSYQCFFSRNHKTGSWDTLAEMKMCKAWCNTWNTYKCAGENNWRWLFREYLFWIHAEGEGKKRPGLRCVLKTWEKRKHKQRDKRRKIVKVQRDTKVDLRKLRWAAKANVQQHTIWTWQKTMHLMVTTRNHREFLSF